MTFKHTTRHNLVKGQIRTLPNILDKAIYYMIKVPIRKRRSAMKHVKNIFAGMGRALVLAPRIDYVRPSTSGFKNDVAALRRDSGIVARGLRMVAKKHDK